VKVERLLLFVVFGRKGIDDKLEIVVVLRTVLVDIGIKAEQLGGREIYLSLHQVYHVNLCRKPWHSQHSLIVFVKDHEFIDYNAVEESEVYPLYFDLSSDFVFESRPYNISYSRLEDRNMKCNHQ